MAEDKKPSSASIISKFFGRLPGQDLPGFMQEFKKLTDEDKKQLADGIADGSLTY